MQKLNQEGVRAVERHDYARAKKLFYKAYLIDPNDPFTLNNLGYISELDGDSERAQRFYSLAAEQPSEAIVDKSTEKSVVGKPVDQISGTVADQRMIINRINIEAMGLLEKDRAPEADVVLQKAYALDPKNPFTLNNLGYTKEREGELELALRFYTRAAALNSAEPIIVAMNRKWRGRAISSVAAENARKVEYALKHQDDLQTRVARLNLRGVSAINRNDRKLARQYFEQAYKLDPGNAFTLNNMGYVAELDGDRETADYFYAKATEANKSDARVAVATRREVEGMRLGVVANTNDRAVGAAEQAALEVRRRQGGPPTLLRRDNTPVVEPNEPPKEPTLVPRPPEPSQPQRAVPQAPQALQTQPVENGPTQGVLPPLPESEQPPAARTGQGNSNSGHDFSNGPVQGVMPPLPDSEQPPAVREGAGQPAPAPR